MLELTVVCKTSIIHHLDCICMQKENLCFVTRRYQNAAGSLCEEQNGIQIPFYQQSCRHPGRYSRKYSTILDQQPVENEKEFVEE